jgi:hypothetical protein
MRYASRAKLPSILKELENLGFKPLQFVNDYGLRLDQQKYDLLVSLFDGSAKAAEFEGFALFIVNPDDEIHENIKEEFPNVEGKYVLTLKIDKMPSNAETRVKFEFTKYNSCAQLHQRLLPQINFIYYLSIPE